MIVQIKIKVKDSYEAHEALAEINDICEVVEVEFDNTVITYRKKEK